MRALRLVLIIALASAPLSVAWGQDVRDGDTLPARVGGLSIAPAFSGGTDRFGPNWSFFGRESILTDFANIDLGRTIAGDNLGPLNGLLGERRDGAVNPAYSGMDSGNIFNGEPDNPLDQEGDPKFLYRQTTLGYTQFEASQTSIGVNFSLAYGITDRLTVAAVLPFASATYKLDAHLREFSTDADGKDIASSYAPLTNKRILDPRALKCDDGNLNIGDNFDRLLDPNAPESYRFSVEDLRRALTSDCLGYVDPFDETYAGDDGYLHGRADRAFSGFRDLILGAKYQWFHGRNFNLSTLAYIVLPTGQPDDPDNLFDLSFGDGQVDAALLVGATIPLGDFRIGISAGYEVQFADTIVRRLNGLTFSDELEGQLVRGEITEDELYDKHLDDGTSTPIVTAFDKANVSRKLGDNIYVYSSFSYQILEWLSVGATIDFLHHFRDEITDTGLRVVRVKDGEGALEGNYNFREVDDPSTPGVIEKNRVGFQTSAEARADVAMLADQERTRLTLERQQDGITAEEQAEIDQGVATFRFDELRARLPNTSERKAAAYAWHTVRSSIVAGLGINVSTIGPFLRDEFPIPLIVSVSAAIPLGGKNLDAIDSFGLSLTIPFVTGEVKDPGEYGFDDDPEPDKGLPWP